VLCTVPDGIINERRWRILGLTNIDNTRNIISETNKVILNPWIFMAVQVIFVVKVPKPEVLNVQIKPLHMF
jgi:hypothetical protein